MKTHQWIRIVCSEFWSKRRFSTFCLVSMVLLGFAWNGEVQADLWDKVKDLGKDVAKKGEEAVKQGEEVIKDIGNPDGETESKPSPEPLAPGKQEAQQPQPQGKQPLALEGAYLGMDSEQVRAVLVGARYQALVPGGLATSFGRHSPGHMRRDTVKVEYGDLNSGDPGHARAIWLTVNRDPVDWKQRRQEAAGRFGPPDFCEGLETSFPACTWTRQPQAGKQWLKITFQANADTYVLAYGEPPSAAADSGAMLPQNLIRSPDGNRPTEKAQQSIGGGQQGNIAAATGVDATTSQAGRLAIEGIRLGMTGAEVTAVLHPRAWVSDIDSMSEGKRAFWEGNGELPPPHRFSLSTDMLVRNLSLSYANPPGVAADDRPVKQITCYLIPKPHPNDRSAAAAAVEAAIEEAFAAYTEHYGKPDACKANSDYPNFSCTWTRKAGGGEETLHWSRHGHAEQQLGLTLESGT